MTARLLVLAAAVAGCAGPRPAAETEGIVYCYVVTEENAHDVRVQITRVSDRGTAGLTLGGRASDAETGDALPGLNVIVEDFQRGAATDAEGQFVLDSLYADQTSVSRSSGTGRWRRAWVTSSGAGRRGRSAGSRGSDRWRNRAPTATAGG